MHHEVMKISWYFRFVNATQRFGGINAFQGQLVVIIDAPTRCWSIIKHNKFHNLSTKMLYKLASYIEWHRKISELNLLKYNDLSKVATIGYLTLIRREKITYKNSL